VIRRRVRPIYQHPELVKKGQPHGTYINVTDGSITDGDDQEWTGDPSVLANGDWRNLRNVQSLGKRRRSSAFTSGTSSPHDEGSVISDTFTRSSSPIEYGGDNDHEASTYCFMNHYNQN
jgi:hypothetical protein